MMPFSVIMHPKFWKSAKTGTAEADRGQNCHFFFAWGKNGCYRDARSGGAMRECDMRFWTRVW